MEERWQRVAELFHVALERDPAERAVFLREACGGDESLCREVESLLTSNDKAGSFLDRPAFQASPDLLDDSLDHAFDGQIGPYRIERLLGRGGMGVVYLAEDTKLGRKVAIKVLPPPYTLDSSRRERLRHEARAAAALSHPGIATVYSLEEVGDTICIVFEHVEGATLREELDRGPLPLDRLIATAGQVARALGAAHASGIVHRDLKPENVIRASDGSVKILDFGLARFQSDERAPTRLTALGTVVGTPGYMAPEQIEGREVDFRADLFAFGVLVYELATGVHPFAGPTVAAMAGRILESDPAPLSQRLAQCPPALERIVRTCLQKAPGDRYQSTGDLIAQFERLSRGVAAEAGAHATGLPAAAVTESPSLSATWWRLHQLAVIVIYGLLAYPMWTARHINKGPIGLFLFIAFVAGAALNGTLRGHLLFTERLNRSALSIEMRRVNSWRRASDWCIVFAAGLAGIRVFETHAWLGALLTAAAVGCLVGFVVIEPSTTRSALQGVDRGATASP